jgi:hypothetical protein
LSLKGGYFPTAIYIRQFFDGCVKGQKSLLSVIPVKTGIQFFQCLANTLDTRLRGNDDFLRNHHSFEP